MKNERIGRIGTTETIQDDSGQIFYVKKLKNPILEPPYPSYLKDEVDLMNNLVHPGIVKPIISDFDPKTGYTFTTPKMENGSLEDLLNGLNPRFYTKENQIIILLSVAHTLAYLHKNCIMHGNLHPGNILLDKNWITHVADYGLNSFVTKSPSQEDAENGRATIYASPELVTGKSFCHNVDVYAFGTLMYRVLFGSNPTGTNNPYLNALYIGGKFQILFPKNDFAKSFEPLINQCWAPIGSRPSFDNIFNTLLRIAHSHAKGNQKQTIDNIVQYFNNASKPAISPKIPENFHVMKFFAMGGNASAMINYAEAFMNGKLFPPNNEKALYYMKYAAEEGNPVACQKLAQLLEEGKFLEKNLMEAYDLYEAASKDEECGFSGYKFAYFLVNGIGGLRNPQGGFNVCLETAQKSKNPDAINYLGELYESGTGVPQDLKKAKENYKIAADLDHPKAQFNLAHLMENEKRPDMNTIMKLYEKASSMEQPDAMNRLGEILLKGTNKIQPDKDRAFYLFNVASAKNNAKAQYNFGLCLMEQGNEEVAIDYILEANKNGCFEARQYISEHNLQKDEPKDIIKNIIEDIPNRIEQHVQEEKQKEKTPVAN